MVHTLVTRNIDCSSLTAAEFAKVMFSDILEAQEKYNELYTPEWVANNIKFFEANINRTQRSAEQFANKKWKTEKRRQEYIAEMVQKARENYHDGYYHKLDFFDFKVDPGSITLSDSCCLDIDKLTFEKLERCFESIKDNKYFKVANGWTLEYSSTENSYCNCSRPQIKLIVDEETAATMKKAAESLADSIHSFYENCTYWGD